MNDSGTYHREIKLGKYIRELPKSLLPASAATDNGHFLFICSSSDVRYTDTYLEEMPAILMGTGGVASIHLGEGEFAYSTDTWGFRSSSPSVSTEYIQKYLALNIEKINFFGFEGSGLKHLRKDYIRKLQVPVPTLEVSKKIVSILDTLDESIEKTDALIEKYQKIKAGLMHDLFTRGIGEDGKLRPTHEQAPELFQETELGWIPKDWSVGYLENQLAQIPNNLRSGPFGSALLKSELVEEGIPFLGIDNIHVEHFDDDFKRFVSEKKFIELNKYAVKPKDVIITIMGTVGRSSVVPLHVNMALSSKHLWTMTFDQSKVFPELICWQLNFAPWVKSWFRRETQGGIMDAIQSKTLRKLKLLIPTIKEQKLILDRYNAMFEKLNSEYQNLQSLHKQKRGLMNDLLTGKVRVSVDSESVDV